MFKDALKIEKTILYSKKRLLYLRVRIEESITPLQLIDWMKIKQIELINLQI